MPMQLEQQAANSIAKGQGRSCTVTFQQATKPGSLLIVVVSGAGQNLGTLTATPGLIQVANPSLSGVGLWFFYAENAISVTSLTVTSSEDKSMQVRAFEHSGMRITGALDSVLVRTSESIFPFTGLTQYTSQPDSLVMAVMVNQYASTTQFGFAGNLIKLIESLSPQSWSGGVNQDVERTRLTIHYALASVIQAFSLAAYLSATRKWLALIICFKGGSTGPAKLTSKNNPPALTDTSGGNASLTVFGKLTSGVTSVVPPLTDTDGTARRARIGPFNYQYLLGGWSGVLIGDDTPYTIDSIEGLEGWDLRTSDDDLPRGDGALRGVDLESARQILIELKVGSDSAGVVGQQADVESAMDRLYRVLVPQRDADWEFIWRHPGRPLRLVRVRPINLLRELDPYKTVVGPQKFALRAADPRHYSAFARTKVIPVTPAGAAVPLPTSVLNAGNGYAYPLITINGPSDGSSVTRVELRNASLDVGFIVETVLPFRSTLVGDMEARATGADRSVVTVDDQTKYGAWQHPRTTFPLGPGANDLTLQTVPAGAPVTCTLTYRDTWSG